MQPGQQMTPEQQEALKQKLENMSPEELKEFQKKQCIFCQLISGKVSSKKIYEDETVMAILDINPANPGHILLLPKEHYAIMPQIPDNEIGHLFMVAKALSQMLLKVLKAEGTNIFVANGLVAGQKAQHFMAHIIPRKDKDGVSIDFPEGILKEDEAKRLVNRLKPLVEKVLGKSKEEKPEEGEEPETKEEPEEEEPKEERPKGPQVYITSSKAKRFHLPTCPFAAKIQPDKRLKFTKEEAETAGYKPCKCTGLLGKKADPVGREAVEHPEKMDEVGEDEEVEEIEETGEAEETEEEAKNQEENETDEEEDEGEEEQDSTLDDISSLLTG